MKTAPPIIVEISRSKITLCSHLHTSPLQVKITPEMVSDLELVELTKLYEAVGQLIDASKLKPARVIYVLSDDVCFSKDFPGNLPPVSEQTQKFIDTVPFHSPSSKLFRVNSGYKLVVVNRALYESVVKKFSDRGFPEEAVVPGFVLEPLGVKSELTAESCRLVLKKTDFLIANSFAGVPASGEVDFRHQEQQFLSRHKAVIIILALAAVAAAVAMSVITFTRRPAPSAYQPPALTHTSLQPTTEPTPEPAPAVDVAAELAKLKVQVLNGSRVPGLAATVQTKLTALGVANAVVGNTSVNSGGKSLVVFRSDLPEAVRSAILTALESEVTEISVQEVSEPQFDVSITAFKNTP